jgi:hypothetical protein
MSIPCPRSIHQIWFIVISALSDGKCAHLRKTFFLLSLFLKETCNNTAMYMDWLTLLRCAARTEAYQIPQWQWLAVEDIGERPAEDVRIARCRDRWRHVRDISWRVLPLRYTGRIDGKFNEPLGHWTYEYGRYFVHSQHDSVKCHSKDERKFYKRLEEEPKAGKWIGWTWCKQKAKLSL